MKMLSLLVVCAFCLGCADEDALSAQPDAGDTAASAGGYFEGGGHLLEDARSTVIRVFDFFAEVEEGVADGFDLDGEDTPFGDDSSCGHGDLSDPDGRTGIDNQLALVWRIIEPLVGDQVRGLFLSAINQGRFLLIIELVGADDTRNAEGVTLNIMRGRAEPLVGNKGLLAPDQTVALESTYPVTTLEDVRIVDGVVEAGPFEFVAPIEILEADFPIQVNDAQIRLHIDEDGGYRGIIGGFIDARSALEELYQTNARAEAELVTPFIMNYTDSGWDGEECRLISMAFEFESTPVFVVRPPADD